MAIKIVKNTTKKSKKKIKPYYQLVYNYMIGDANGYTTEDSEVSVDNPYLERYVKLLNKLESTKGHWGVMLEEDRLNAHCKEGQITKDDLKFLKKIMFNRLDGVQLTEEEEGYIEELSEGVRSEAEYSFLVFEGVDLFYYDENNKKYETKISK